MVNYKGVSF